MPEFKDNEGRNWTVHVACAEVECVRKKLGIDLLDPKQFGEVISDPIACAAVLAVCCQTEARSGVDRESFMRAIWGDVVDDARKALAEAVIRFFPGRARRDEMTRAMRDYFAEATETPRNAGDGSSPSAQASSA